MYSIEGQSVVLLEKRRLMDGEMIERPFAKATWVKSQEVWKLYWQRADLRWHSYSASGHNFIYRGTLQSRRRRSLWACLEMIAAVMRTGMKVRHC